MARKRPDHPLPPSEPGPAPGVLSLDAIRAAQRDDLAELAARKLTNARWREGHADGWIRGAQWAARELGAAVILRPPANAPPRLLPHDTLDDV